MSAKTIKAGDAFLELTVRDDQFAAGLDRATSRLRAFSGAITGIGRDLAAIGGLATGALVAFPLKLAANLEVSQAAFTAMIGSARKASEILTGLQEFAGESTFDFQSLQNSARTMLNFGVSADQVLPLMRQLGAIALGDSDRLDRLAIAFGQTSAKGRLMAEEVRQMVNAGFNPLQEISRTTGQSMGNLISEMEKGNISAEQMAGALDSATGSTGRFGKILDAIQQTTFGQFRKALASSKIALTELGNQLLSTATRFLKSFNDMIPAIRRFINGNADLAFTIAKVTITIASLGFALIALGTILRNTAAIITGVKLAIALLYAPPVTKGIALTAAAIAGIGVAAVVATKKTLGLVDQLRNVGLIESPLAAAGRLQGSLRVRPPAQRPTNPPANFGAIGGGLLGDALNSGVARTLKQLLGGARLGASNLALAAGGAQGDLSREVAKRQIERILEGERLDDEIARLEIEAIKDEFDKAHANSELEATILKRELQRAGLGTKSNLARVDRRAQLQLEAALAEIKDPEINGFSRSTFSGRLAQQVLGIGGQTTDKQQLAELLKIAKDIHFIRNKKNGGFAVGND